MAYGTVNVGNSPDSIPTYDADIVKCHDGVAWIRVWNTNTQNLPNRFNIRLMNNTLITPQTTDANAYKLQLFFLACTNGGDPATEPADYERLIYVYDSDAYLMVAYAYHMALTNGYLYEFECKEDENAYVLLNPMPMARNTVGTTTTHGFGLSRVLNTSSRSKFNQGEALSAHQGYLLKQQNISAIQMYMDNESTSQYYIPSDDPSLTSITPYEGMLITVIPDVTSNFVTPTIKIAKEQGGSGATYPICIKDINGNFIIPPPDFLKAYQAVALMFSNNCWNVLNLTSLQPNDWIATTEGTGSAYTVTLTPAPTQLKVGMKITIIPHADSETTTPTLNVNGFGAKYIKRRSASVTDNMWASNIHMYSSLREGFPINLMYDGDYWIIYDSPKTAYSDLDGAPAYVIGGVTSKSIREIYAGTTAMTSGTTALTTGTIYLQYEA